MNIHNTAYGQLIKKYEHLRQREKYVKNSIVEYTFYILILLYFRVVKENEDEKMSPKPEEHKNEELSYVIITI